MSPRNVPFFDYPFLFKSDEKAFTDIFIDVGRRGAFIMQEDVFKFEQALAQFTGAPYVVSTANATDAMQILLMASGIKSGDEVIICSHTMIATASAIYFAGGTPVPAEVGHGHTLDVNEIEHLITQKTKAVMPTQLNGRCADMSAIQDIAEKYNLMIFEDSAQALGSRYKGKHAGTFGRGGCISFFPAKVMGCFGDGGAILCNDDSTYKMCLKLRDHGRGEDGEITHWGFNSRLDNLHAATLHHLLKKYDSVIERRREIAGLYERELAGVSQVTLPPAPNEDKDYFDIYQNYEIEAERRDQLAAYLADQRIGSMVQWSGKAVHQWKNLKFDCSLKKTDELFKKILMIPMNMSLQDDDVKYVADKIKAFYGT